jgi:hypothetical protein
LCDSTPEPAPKYLCAYHTNMKIFLDAKGSKLSDSSKYLPRKNPPLISATEQDRDLKMVRAASTLLQELWDGKLKGTLKSFSSKVCEEMGFRKRLSSIVAREKEREKAQSKHRSAITYGSFSPPRFVKLDLVSPPWARWKDEAAQKVAVLDLANEQANLDLLLTCERAITTEIATLDQAGIYPSAELAIIRKDMKSFRDAQESNSSAGSELDSGKVVKVSASGMDVISGNVAQDMAFSQYELRISEKKLDLLRRRRQDEDETRAAVSRKLARQQALLDKEAKDPRAFRNQGASRFS